MILSAGPRIGAADLDLHHRTLTDDDGAAGRDSAATELVVLDSFDVKEAERVLIQRALEETGGNRTRAAALLGVSVRTLRNQLNRD